MHISSTVRRLSTTCIVLLTLLAVPNAIAATRVALVIGNAAYSDKPLVNPRNDANDVGLVLTQLGFAVSRHTDLGRRGLNDAVRKFASDAAGSEIALVYYSGHGLQAAGENYLVPVDARILDEKDIRTEGIALRDLLGDLDETKAQRIVVVLDACRDNPFSSRAKSMRRGLARQEVAGNSTLVVFSTSEGRTADDGSGRNGVYTGELLNQLRRTDQDIRDVFDETAIAVSRKKTDQRPKIYGDTGAFKGVYLSGRTPVAANSLASLPRPRAGAEEEAWDEIKTSNNLKSLQAFLQEFPNGAFAARVRMRVASLSPMTEVPVRVPVASPPAPALQATTSTSRPAPSSPTSWLDR